MGRFSVISEHVARLTTLYKDIFTDVLYPNIYGVAQIAQRLTEIIKD